VAGARTAWRPKLKCLPIVSGGAAALSWLESVMAGAGVCAYTFRSGPRRTRKIMSKAAPTQSVDKLREAITLALPLLPPDVANQVKALLTPEALATMATVVTVWAGAHFFGVGEIADIALLTVGYFALGGVAWQAAKQLMAFVNTALGAKTEDDLKLAARHFSNALALLSVQTILVILLKKRPATFTRKFVNPAAPFPKLKQLGSGPRNSAGWFYRPKITRTRELDAGVGETSVWGDIEISTRGSLTDRRLALYHERVHQFLTPRLYLLREYRVYPAARGYSYSYLLRYLEEALAETLSRFKVSGRNISSLKTGVSFPVENGYVTLRAMGSEAAGILLGPVTGGGMAFNAFFQQGHAKYR
jgi:hypothetical protein